MSLDAIERALSASVRIPRQGDRVPSKNNRARLLDDPEQPSIDGHEAELR
jgi:hypothetical protein